VKWLVANRGEIVNSELLDFVRAALARRLSRPEIARVLRAAGWQEADIERALDAFAELEFPLPVPKPQPYMSAREVFTYLVLFAALYVSALNLASLAFIFIDHYFPGPLQNHSLSAAADTIRWNVASLIVAFPLFLFTFRAINKANSEDPSKRGSRPRKWLVYLTLWVAVLVLTGETQRVDLQDTWRRAYNPVRAQSHYRGADRRGSFRVLLLGHPQG
jgi:Domain of unknown function (DUF5671)